MGLVVYLIALFFVGLVVGALARLLLPGPDPMGIGMTALVGLCGTFSAGLFSWYVLIGHPLCCLDHRRERAKSACPVQGLMQTSPSRRR